MKLFILTLFFITIFFKTTFSFDLENLSEVTEDLEKAQKELKNVTKSDNAISQTIDNAVLEIDKATEFVKETLKDGNIDEAVSTLEFIELSLSNVSNLIPQELKSDMTKVDMTSIDENKMSDILSITEEMGENKKKKLNDLVKDMQDVKAAGLEIQDITKNLDDLGIETIELPNINLEEVKEMESWTKKAWAQSYDGSLLTNYGSSVITDKEIEDKLIELEANFKKNNLDIENKKTTLVSLNNQLDPINLEISKLKNEKDELTNQYNLELSKFDLGNLTIDEIEKNKALTAKLENDLQKLVADMEAANSRSSSLENEITSINKNLSQDISLSNSISGSINKLNKDKFDLQNQLSLKRNEINNLKTNNTDLANPLDIQALEVKVEQSKNLQQQLDNVEKELINKNNLLSQKRSEISQLNNEINPLDLEINNLSNKKNELITKYNQELKNLNKSVNNEEIIESRILADNLSNEIINVSSQIQNIENSKLGIKNNLTRLNTELNIETKAANELSGNLISLNQNLSNIQEGFEAKEIELARIKELPSNLSKQNKDLEQQLQKVSLERDFIQTQFAKSIDKEVEAVEYFYPLLDKMSADEIDFAMEEVGVLLDGDPRKANAFDIRKYGTLAGLSQSEIQAGVNAVQNDDWNTTKKVYKDIISKMSKNSDYVVDIPSEAELNVMIAEEKALLQAVEIVKKGDQIKQQVDAIINEKTKSYQPLVGLNKTVLQYAVLSKGSLEAELVNKEFDKIVNNDLDLKSLTTTLEEKQKQLKDIQVFQELKTKEINNAIKPLQDQVANTYAELNDINRNYTLKSLEKTTYINSIGGYASLYRDKGNANYGNWVKNIGQLDQELYDIGSKSREKLTEAQNISSEIYKIQLDNSTSQTDINNWINLQRDVGNLALEKSRKVGAATDQARSNVIAIVDDAKSNIQKITNEELAKNPDYNYVEKVNKILDEIPSFGVGQRKNATEAITGIGNLNIWAGGSLVDVGDKTAALRAALDSDPNRYEAYMTAVDKIKDIGKESSFKGPYWEMTNVKLALVVQSKLEGNMDYVYVSESDRIQLNSTERAEIEKELTSILGNNNPKLNALNKHSEALKSQLDYNNVQLTNLNSSVSKLESELNSIKSNEEQIKAQITQINSDLSSKKNIISEKQSSLQNLQNELNPFTTEINNLEQKRENLNLEVEKQLSIIADKVNNSEKVTANANKIKDELNKELNEIDDQLNGLKSNSKTLKANISNLNNDIKNLETETPELSNQLTKLNKDLNQFVGIEGELAALTNTKKTQIENIDLEVAKLENEIKDLKSAEDVLNSQIIDLSSQLEVNLNTIDQKKLSISNLEDQLTPINNSIKNLETQQKDLANEFDNGLHLIANQVQSKDDQNLRIQQLKNEFDQKNVDINAKIESFKSEANNISVSVANLNKEISTIEISSPEIETQITKLNQDLKDFTNLKADLAISEAKKMNMELEIEQKIIENIAPLENKSIIKLDGSNTFRVVDTSVLTDNSGQFKMPEGTMTVNNNVYTAGAVQADQLLSFKEIDQEGDFQVKFSQAAIKQLSDTGEIKGGTQAYTGSTIGSWVLVDAKTGKQMVNPNNGHSGSIVCDVGTCGTNGSFGKEASSFGGVYVMENIADPITGNVAGRCAGGNCQFNFSSSSVVTDSFSQNTSEVTESIAKTSSQVTELTAATKANITAAREVTEQSKEVVQKTLTSSSDVASNVIEKLKSIQQSGIGSGTKIAEYTSCVGNNCGLSRLQQTIKEINKSQEAARNMIASGTGNTITNALSTQTAADALAGQMARDMVQGASNEANSTSQAAREAQAAVESATAEVSAAAAQVASATTEAAQAAAQAAQAAAQAAQAAAQAQVAAAQAAAEAAQAAVQAAQAAAQEIQQAARDAQDAASDVVAGISGNDLAALGQLANDALGIWQEVDAQGRAVNNQQIVCQASMCGAEGAFGKAAASRGNTMVRTNRTGGY